MRIEYQKRSDIVIPIQFIVATIGYFSGLFLSHSFSFTPFEVFYIFVVVTLLTMALFLKIGLGSLVIEFGRRKNYE